MLSVFVNKLLSVIVGVGGDWRGGEINKDKGNVDLRYFP